MKTKPSRLQKLLTISEVAEHLRLCSKTVTLKIKTGEIPAVYVGRRRRVTEDDLVAYLNRSGRKF